MTQNINKKIELIDLYHNKPDHVFCITVSIAPFFERVFNYLINDLSLHTDTLLSKWVSYPKKKIVYFIKSKTYK